MDLTDFQGYSAAKAGYRHHGFATVGWLDGHVKTHRKSFVFRRQDQEDGATLLGNNRLINWNLY